MTDRICSVEDCVGRFYAFGWCQKHYKRMQKHGSLELVLVTPPGCSVEGCDHKHKGNGLCDMHRQRMKHTGTTDDPPEFTPEMRRETTRRYLAAHPEQSAAYQRKYRAANREQMNAAARARYSANPEAENERAKAWRDSNPDKASAAVKAWAQANPWRVRSLNSMKDARRRAPSVYVEFVDLESVLAEHGPTCHVCGEALDAEFHFDHVIPLIQGGDHVRSNLLPAHIACNIRKGATLDATPDDIPRVATG